MKKIFLVLGVLALMLASCKDENAFGEGLQPEKDKLSLTLVDTIAVKAHNFVPTQMPIGKTDDFIVGGLWDETSGLVSAGFAAQMRYANLGLYADSAHLRDAIIIDSAYVFLSYFDIWGDSSSVNEIEVYELSSAITNFTTPENRYTSDFNVEEYYADSTFIGKKKFRVNDEANEYTTLEVSGVALQTYALRIPLPTSIQNRILNNIDTYNDASNSTAGSAIFQEDFKGIYVKHTFGTGALINIETASGMLRMQFDYHDPNEDYPDTLDLVDPIDSVIIRSVARNMTFYTNNECARLAIVDNDVTGSTVSDKLNSTDVTFTGVRGGGALRTKLSFPDFTLHPDFRPLEGEDSARILINSAVLTLHLNQDLSAVNDAYHTSQLVAYLDDGTTKFIKDANSTITRFEASYDATSVSYTFDLTNYIQAKVSTQDNDLIYDLVLGLENEIVSPEITFLNTVNSKENPTTLKILYTRY